MPNHRKVMSSLCFKHNKLFQPVAFFSTKVLPQTKKTGSLSAPKAPSSSPTETRKPVIPANCRFIYPEFLPNRKIEWRNPIREKLE
ncbi:large ribosomal subunit protein bL19m-like isoform 2-T4 [Glossina fuscipes fuscipes]